jgi:hypothetical protein
MSEAIGGARAGTSILDFAWLIRLHVMNKLRAILDELSNKLANGEKVRI